MPSIGRPLTVIFALIFCISASGQVPPVDEEQQKAIAKLFDRALSTEDTEAQIRVYRQILQIDPTNQNAFNGIERAKQKLEQERKDREKLAKDREKAEQDRGREKEQGERQAESVKQADGAIAAGNLESARVAVDTLRKLNPNDTNLGRLESDLQTLMSYRQWTLWGTGGVIAMFCSGLAVLIFILRGRTTPFLEVAEGKDAGTQYPLTKEITLIGSVEKFEDLANDIVFSDPEGRIAKAHCEIHKKDKKLYLIDLFSANGTMINDQPAEPEKAALLQAGSRINLGGALVLRLGYAKNKSK